ncbi:hypothetical protein AJ80_06893 [Polytolypa hystricis UAMH7299]|uniref:Uncharacterized protein n=1 Tax=Polytolypa hystricis (strain UAMH7299) TaxID=1447883 RepID=A0A2B7XSR5_POLH7|nr:hypothetical protein AJ80_06893 [Polytolypa hystricis UAMH7299]
MFIDENSVCQARIQTLNSMMRSVRIQRAKALRVEDAEAYAESLDMMAIGYIPGPRCIHHALLEGKERFLTFEGKIDPETKYELLCEQESPALYKRLQRVVVEAFITGRMHETLHGLRLNPRPVAFFYPAKSNFADVNIDDIPGGYEGAVNIFIMNYYLQNPQERATRYGKVAASFGIMAPSYDNFLVDGSRSHAGPTLQEFEFDGEVLDLGYSTGLLG